MPYICLTNASVPDGTLQILDLLPNASLRVPAYDPPAQSRYVNYAENETLILPTAGKTLYDTKGLAAYLVDNIEPGGLFYGTADITLGVTLEDDTITLGGVVFTATDTFPADPALQEFLSDTGSGSDKAVAAQSLIDAVNDSATQALLLAAGSTVTATAGGSLGAGDVTLTADELGQTGSLTLVTSAPTLITLSDDHLARTFEKFTATQINALATAILARMVAAQALTSTDLNTLINAQAGVSGCSIASAMSTLTVPNLLSLLSGRGYTLPKNSVIYDSYNAYHSAPAGSFTHAQKKNDTNFLGGEYYPTTPGGDTVYEENKGIRSTYYTDSFYISIDQGTLAKYASGDVTLWPISETTTPTFPWTYMGGLHNYSSVTGRVITVYGDDGSVLV